MPFFSVGADALVSKVWVLIMTDVTYEAVLHEDLVFLTGTRREAMR